MAEMEDGKSLSDIGQALGKHVALTHAIVMPNGGMMPTMRKRSRRALTLEEREEISRGIRGAWPGAGRSGFAPAPRTPRHAGAPHAVARASCRSP
jgi:hypothetical protein